MEIFRGVGRLNPHPPPPKKKNTGNKKINYPWEGYGYFLEHYNFTILTRMEYLHISCMYQMYKFKKAHTFVFVITSIFSSGT